MPYSRISQLPDPIRNSLPPSAQEVFVKAFNQAYARLKPGEDEVIAFKMGWAAVKRTFEKREGKWMRKYAPRKSSA